MSDIYPKSLGRLIEDLKHLPGVGEKTAQRYAFSLLKEDHLFIESLAQDLRDVKNEIISCPKCGFISEKGRCMICDDLLRDHTTIMVVSYDQDVIAMEKTDTYHGLYHVLKGVISSSKGIYPEDLNITSLLDRLDGVKEVIIAISPTIDGETTALYLEKILAKYDVLVTRIAHGLPMGASLDYADELTLIQALNNRRSIKE